MQTLQLQPVVEPKGTPVSQGSVEARHCLLKAFYGREVLLLASARSGLNLFLATRGLSRYHDELLVPMFASRCVDNAVNAYAFPSRQYSPRTRGILLYHQFGYPQRSEVVAWAREQGLFIVEDCAHAFFGAAGLGRFLVDADLSFVSFPKFFATGLGGAVLVRDPAVHEALRQRLRERPSTADDADGSRMLRAVVEAMRAEEGDRTRLLWDLELAYESLLHRPGPIDAACALLPDHDEDLHRHAEMRRGRLRLFKEAFLGRGYPDGLLDDDVVPFALPFFGRYDYGQLGRVARKLAAEGVRTSIYHFDVRQNQLEPEYRPCVLVPCHAQVGDDRFVELCQVIRRAAEA